MRVLESSSTDVHANLALEEWWLDHFEEMGSLLLFYTNASAVVLGKNQNPWRECATGLLSGVEPRLARRVSGGGAVYHDDGNLNYALVLPRGRYAAGDVFHGVLTALRTLGLAAHRADDNSLWVGDRKVSGSAFCFRGSAVLHHGTLLLAADLPALTRFLQPALPGLATRAIPSRPASVMNLREVRSDLTMELLRDALRRVLAPDAGPCDASAIPADAWKERRIGLASWDWVYGHTPAFCWDVETEDGRLAMHVEKGRVHSAVVHWCRDRQEELADLVGVPFGSASLAAALGPQHSSWSRQLQQLKF
jgi:lipoate-protein ligase A